MSLRYTWRPRVDDVDDADSSAVNQIAQAVIDAEEELENRYTKDEIDNKFKDLDIDIEIDMKMSDTSENAVQNKVIKKYVDDEILSNAIISSSDGKIIHIYDSANAKIQELKIYGRTEQDGEPSPENPQSFNSIGEDGDVEINIHTKNLFDVDKFIELVKTYDNRAEEMVVDGRNCIKFDIYQLYKKDFSEVVTFNKSKVYTWSMDIKFCERFSSTSTSDCYLYMGFLYNNELGAETNIAGTISGVPLKNRRLLNSMYSFEQFGKVSITSANGVPFNGIAFSYNDRGYWLIDLDSIQLEEGSVVTYYEPYTIQSLTLSTPNGLPGVLVDENGTYTDADGQQWICDEIDLARGVYIQRVGEYILELQNVEDYTSFFSSRITPPFEILPDVSRGLCDKGRFLGIGSAQFDVTGSGIDFYFYPESDGEITSVEQVKEVMNGSKMLLIRKTPIEIPLSAEEIEAYKSLQTYKPVTHIFNDEGAHMAVKYIADTKNYIDNKIAELQTSLLNATT